jgi:hypothetical protein
MTRKMALLSLLGCITPSMLHAQEAAQTAPRRAPSAAAPQAQAQSDNEVDAVVITGERQRGAVLGDIAPEETFTAADVRSFGVSSINDLLSEIAAQTTSGRGGTPVVLLNGRRISSQAEIRDIPTEAIQRVEILPEEVALKYGYSAEQKVVNIVLRERFRANTAEASLASPTDGGQTTEQLDANSLRLNKEGRVNLAVKVLHSDELLESDRDLVSTSGDPADTRSLLPKTDQVSVNAVVNKIVHNTISATVNASASYAQSTSLLGLANGDTTDVLGAMDQNSRDVTGHLGFTLNDDSKAWRWSLTGNYDHATNRTSTDRDVDTLGTGFRSDIAHSTTDTGNIQLVTNGTLLKLPAGDLSTTVKLGAEGSSLDASSTRSGVASGSDLSRTSGNAQVSFDLPITSRKNDFLAGFGDLSANLNLAVNQLSDFGTLTTVGYGVSWTPIKPISFIVSMTDQENAPSMAQLGSPSVATPDVKIYDFVRGETVEVTRIAGGNPDLKAEDKHVLKIGVTVKPASINGLSLNANYFRTRIDNPIASFPAATSATEAAFPDRFTRDTDGVLTRIDARAVNFARQESDQIRWGINFSRQIGKTPPRPVWAGRRGEGGPGAGGPGAGQDRPAGAQAQGAQTSPLQTSAAAAASASQTQGQTQTTVKEGDQPPGMNLLQGVLPPGGEAQRTQPQPEPNVPSATDTARAGGGGQGPGGWGGPGGPGGPGGFGPPPGIGAARLQLALYHTIHLRERVYIGDGSAPLDLLDGDALSSSGGQPRHEIEAQAGITKSGLGARLTANWRSATHVDQGLGGASTALRFSDLTTLNLRLFSNLSAQRDLVTAYPFFRGTRVTFAVTNLLDAHMKVRDAAGVTPVSYQPDYLDPLGRSVRLSFRKVFF